jgi:hypothetical protein
MGAASAQDPPDHPRSRKGDSEISLRGTEPVMNGGNRALVDHSSRPGAHRLFGKGWRRGPREYKIDWLPAIVLTKPSVVHSAGIAPLLTYQNQAFRAGIDCFAPVQRLSRSP